MPFEPKDAITSLLQRGLDHYGRNEVEEAVKCWAEVLAHDPKHPAALDYLESAGVDVAQIPAQQAEIIDFDVARAQLGSVSPTPPSPSVVPPPLPPGMQDGEIEPSLKRLLSERRYEEALDFLYAVRSRRPNDAAISRSIKLIREKLVVTYVARLVNLDHVPVLTRPLTPQEFGAEVRQVLALVDGVSTYADIVAASSAGRLAALRTLCSGLEGGIIQSAPALKPHESSSRFRAPLQPSLLAGIAAHSPSPPPSSDRRLRAPEPRPSPDPPPAAVFLGAPSTRARSFDDSPPSSAPPPVAPKAPASVRPAAASAAPDDPYRTLFDRATEAYLIRDYRRAYELFSSCCKERPDDTRAQHNLKALKKRLGEA